MGCFPVWPGYFLKQCRQRNRNGSILRRTRRYRLRKSAERHKTQKQTRPKPHAILQGKISLEKSATPTPSQAPQALMPVGLQTSIVEFSRREFYCTPTPAPILLHDIEIVTN